MYALIFFRTLVESNRKLLWDDAYSYFDGTTKSEFKYLGWILPIYRDKLLKIDESSIPKGSRLIPKHVKSQQEVKSLLEDCLSASGYRFRMSKQDMEIAISRYRWFGDEVLDIYKSNPSLLFYHTDTRFLMQMLYPNEDVNRHSFPIPDGMDFYKPLMTVSQKMIYDTPVGDRPWGQLWGYAKSRPTSVSDDVRNAIKLQFRNQSYYDMI